MPPVTVRRVGVDPRFAQAVGSNRREFRRTPANKSALMRLASGERLPCRIVDISAGGAGIEVADGVAIPDQFKLLIPDDLFEAECEVRHLSGTSAGLIFTSNRMEALAAYG
ncbi:MAG: PilZ domain-containing protein [Pseudomonadota bacterium]